MSFIAAEPVPPEDELPHHPFWPAISPKDFRARLSIDGTVTPARLNFALIEAVVSVNRDLKAFRVSSERNGFAMLEAVPDDEPGRLAALYRRAVYELAAADLMERYLRFDATLTAQKHAALQEPTIDHHRRNAFWALRDILGERRSTICLL